MLFLGLDIMGAATADRSMGFYYHNRHDTFGGGKVSMAIRHSFSRL